MKKAVVFGLFFIIFFSKNIFSQNSNCIEIILFSREAFEGDTITFNANISSMCNECDSISTQQKYYWKFPGTNSPIKEGTGPHHVTYKTFGYYDVELEVVYLNQKDNKECKVSSTRKNAISIIPRTPSVIKNFRAKSYAKRVIVSWETIFERNMKSFLIEKSVDGNDFHAIEVINATGNHRKVEQYHANDLQPFAGNNYYRLRQITQENHSVNFDTVIISNWKNLDDMMGLNQGEKVLVIINDKEGNELFSKVVIQKISGDTIFAVDPLETILPGKYLIMGSSNTEIQNKQLIIKD